MACLVSLDDLHFRNATRIPGRLQESTKVAKINSLGTRVVPKQQQEQGGGSEKEEEETFYDFDYSLETTRGNKRVLSTVCIKAGVLFIANGQYFCGDACADDAAATLGTIRESLETFSVAL